MTAATSSSPSGPAHSAPAGSQSRTPVRARASPPRTRTAGWTRSRPPTPGRRPAAPRTTIPAPGSPAQRRPVGLGHLQRLADTSVAHLQIRPLGGQGQRQRSRPGPQVDHDPRPQAVTAASASSASTSVSGRGISTRGSTASPAGGTPTAPRRTATAPRHAALHQAGQAPRDRILHRPTQPRRQPPGAPRRRLRQPPGLLPRVLHPRRRQPPPHVVQHPRQVGWPCSSRHLPHALHPRRRPPLVPARVHGRLRPPPGRSPRARRAPHVVQHRARSGCPCSRVSSPRRRACSSATRASLISSSSPASTLSSL